MVAKPQAPPVTTPEPLPSAPTRSEAETAALAEEQRTRGSRPGRASTFLNSGGGMASTVGRFLTGSGL